MKALDRERKYPRGQKDLDTAFFNFMKRCGATGFAATSVLKP
jgi:hypothetical protein